MISGNEQFERDFEAFLKEDDSRLAALYRKLPQPEPDAKLDAAVLAMAHRTLNPHLVATPLASTLARRRVRWLAPLGAAAGLVLAAGVALRVGPQIWGEHDKAAAPAAARDNGVIQVRPIDEAAPPPPASPPPPPAEAATPAPAAAMSMQAARAMKAKPAPAPEREVAREEAQPQAAAAASVISADRADVDAKELKKVENAASQPAPPQAFPAQGRREPEMDAVERKQAIATGAWQKLHDNETAGGAPAGMVAPKPTVTRSAPAPAASALGAAATTATPSTRAKSAVAPEANAVAPTTQADTAATAPEQEKFETRQQPAYSTELIRNSRLYPESWVAAIQRLVREGRRDDALQNLDLFRKKYPSYHLPSDLERLSAPQK